MVLGKEKNIDYPQKVKNLENEIAKLKLSLKEVSVLYDLAITTGRTIDQDKLLDVIVQKTILALKAEQASIQLVTPNKDSTLNTLIRREAQSGTMPSYKIGSHITGWLLKNKQPLIIESLADDNRFRTTQQEQSEIKTIIGVPIWLHAEIMGVFIVTNKRTGEPFNSSDLRLLTIVASEAGQLIYTLQLQKEAIERKRLEHELDLARKIQMSLLPESRQLNPMLDIESYFLSADAVSGDYYDYFILDKNKIGIVIADVSGHGPSAALMMTMLKGILHSVTSQFVSPDLILKEINSIFFRVAPPEMFVTMMFLIIDTDRQILQYSNAGHNPILFFNSKNNLCEEIKLDGCAINISDSSDFIVREIPLQKNDLFVIYTDGITEAFNDINEMFGVEKLVQAIDEVKDSETSEIIENVKAGLSRFTGNRSPEDDIALIAVKING